MKQILLLFLLGNLFSFFSCSKQQAVVYNTKDGKYGLTTPAGKLILDAQYLVIRPYFDVEKNVFEGENRSVKGPLPFFIIVDQDRNIAIADQFGKIIFDFIEAESLEIDSATNTVVVMKKPIDGRRFSQLYSLDGELLDTTIYKRIGYFEDNELIILETDDSDVIYLFNTQTNTRIGPFEHFNWWPEIRYFATRNKEQQWGLLDEHGTEVFPMKYVRMSPMRDEYKMHPYHQLAEKPAGVNFIITAKIEFPTRLTLLYDENLKEYKYVEDQETRTRRVVPTGN